MAKVMAAPCARWDYPEAGLRLLKPSTPQHADRAGTVQQGEIREQAVRSRHRDRMIRLGETTSEGNAMRPSAVGRPAHTAGRPRFVAGGGSPREMRESSAAWNKIGPVVPRRGLIVVVTRGYRGIWRPSWLAVGRSRRCDGRGGSSSWCTADSGA